MKTFIFQKDGEALKVKFIFKGFMIATYNSFMMDTENKTVVNWVAKGSNLPNSELDEFALLQPVSLNNKKRVFLVSDLIRTDEDLKDYTIKIEVFQGSKKIGEDKDDGTFSKISDRSIFSFLLISN